MPATLFEWIWRLALAALVFVAIWFGLPWFLQTVFHIVWPDILIGLIALVFALAVLTYRLWLGPRRVSSA